MRLISCFDAAKFYYNMSFVYSRELASGTVSLTGDWSRGEDSKQYRYFNT